MKTFCALAFLVSILLAFLYWKCLQVPYGTGRGELAGPIAFFTPYVYSSLAWIGGLSVLGFVWFARRDG